jgi:redox-sensitive bicupin YhaK (pirin superfamily)
MILTDCKNSVKVLAKGRLEENMKKVQQVLPSPQGHWVGDGFPVRSLFSHGKSPERFSPFLMLDYGGPTYFDATTEQRGVDSHPHRGFETVTIVYQGELEHRDSAGHHGEIGPGDVQWMTAASGVLHEEYHGKRFAQNGGHFEMAQLWVNLPATHKMSPPRYQTLLNAQIPTVALPDGGGTVRVIAGEYSGERGPAQTVTPLDVWDVRLKAGHRVTLPIADGHSALAAVLHGRVLLDGGQEAREVQLVIFERHGENITLEAREDTTILLMSGEPIDEPIAAYGPFVMNTQQEIQQAITDFRSGKFGQLT